MARLRNEGPYFWVTWLTKLLAGESSCQWASWFRAHHASGSWDQVPSGLDRVAWQMTHTAMVNEASREWEALGYQVSIERQNDFTLKGEVAALGGQPDLVAIREDVGAIIDVKTGRPNSSHVIEVLLDMYALPRSKPEYRNIAFEGQVAYGTHSVDVPARLVDDQFIGNLSRLINELALHTPARRVPSPGECRFCPITLADCTVRAEDDSVEQDETTDF